MIKINTRDGSTVLINPMHVVSLKIDQLELVVTDVNNTSYELSFSSQTEMEDSLALINGVSPTIQIN